MLGIGPLELVIVLLIVLVLFGAKRLPQTGRSLGAGMREFKEGIVHGDADEEHQRADRGEIEATGAPDARPVRD